MNVVWADLHCHVGGLRTGQPVKISADRGLTVVRALSGGRRRGMDIIGLVDCHVPGVEAELREMMSTGTVAGLPGGGLRTDEGLTVLPGSEVEVAVGCRAAHFVVLYRSLDCAAEIRRALSEGGANTNLSTQRLRGWSLAALARTCRNAGWLLIIAHAFTPYRGLFGVADGLAAVGCDPGDFSAIELGLSVDAALAAHVPSISTLPWLSNSDAHSARSIGREFNELSVTYPDFDAVATALTERTDGAITANYGMWPDLGKYHRTACRSCRQIASGLPPATRCAVCGSASLITGVADRIWAIGTPHPIPQRRPPYHRLIPLAHVPGCGPASRDRLLDRYGSEHYAVYHASLEQLETIAPRAAPAIAMIRRGQFTIEPGGGGRFGRVKLTGDRGDINDPIPSYNGGDWTRGR